MQGLHLTADLDQCRCAPEWLTQAALLAVGGLLHTFTPVGEAPAGPCGVAATILLAESPETL